jgi:hypothetical protein
MELFTGFKDLGTNSAACGFRDVRPNVPNELEEVPTKLESF